VSAAVAVIGGLFGFLTLVVAGEAYGPSLRFHNAEYWLKNWAGVLGVVLLGLVFLAGSILGLRNRRRASLLFLISAPVVAFFLAFASAGHLVWAADGGGYFESPFISSALWLAFLFFLPLVLPLFALKKKSKKLALILFVGAAALVTPAFIASRWTSWFLPELAAWSALLATFGSFWLKTDQWGSSPLLAPFNQPRSTRRKIAGWAFVVVAIVCLDVAFTGVFVAMTSSLFSVDCNAEQPFTHPLNSEHAVFVASVIFTGFSIDTWRRKPTYGFGGSSQSQIGDFAIGVVKEKFWGLPSWVHFVLLTRGVYWKGEVYFVDGRRYDGLLSRYLPIVDGGISCSRTRPVAQAEIDLRELRRHSRLASGAQIIGYAMKPQAFRSFFAERPIPPIPMPGAQISATGSTGTWTAVADQHGIYELDGMAPDHYKLKIALPQTQSAADQEVAVTGNSAQKSEIFERDFRVSWNGMLDGKVIDDEGQPANVSVELISIEGARLAGDAQSFSQTGKDGSFHLSMLPPGRFALTVNSYGPSDASPFVPQLGGVAVLDLSPGERARGIKLIVKPGVRRTLRVHVAWPNGRRVSNASVSVAYDRPSTFVRPVLAQYTPERDQSGNGEISIFGDSMVRVFATGHLDIYSLNWVDSNRYSDPADLDAKALPNQVNFVLHRTLAPEDRFPPH
jgi:hypothetical protein